MQVPILNGIYTDNGPDFRTAYPVNLIPTPVNNGISQGYLRPADGIVSNGTGPGVDRGGINWNGTCYRVMGTKLVSVSSNGVVTTLGDVGGSGLVTFDYSFDRLAICSSGNLYYWNGTLTQVTDPDIGNVIDFCWVDGYFMATDGEFLTVTELTDPTSVNPLKYGSSEADPDPINAIIKLRNEVYALNRHTIEVFSNVGGSFFPFGRVEGAQVQKGAIGTHGSCVFAENIAFIGGGRNESPGIYLASNANAVKISTAEVDLVIQQFTESELKNVKVEARTDRSHQYLYVHLPDRAMVYDLSASQSTQSNVWFTLNSSLAGFSQYRAKNLVWAYDKWLVGDTNTANVGYFVDNVGSHWGDVVRWEFGTSITYNGGMGAIFNQLELVALTGRIIVGKTPTISTSYSVDGEAWSQSKTINAGNTGDRKKRLVWFKQGSMRNWRIQRFMGTTDAHLSFARLEAQIEPLGV